MRRSIKETNNVLKKLKSSLSGALFYDDMMKASYATDASIYRSLPLAVATPKGISDVKKLIAFATENKVSLIPRSGGTSLAGQCVGDGIVVDVSRYFNRVIEINTEEKWAKVEPGVIRDELNHYLKPHGLFFGPNTSTSNRATIGGMVGNNSCGSTSIVYGSTRDHILEIEAILSDGSEVVFKQLNKTDFEQKLKGRNFESTLYRQIDNLLTQKSIRTKIKEAFPDPRIKRRNTGYALDYLVNTEIYGDVANPFDLCKLVAGSEGTLAFTTTIKISLQTLPEPEEVVLCAHFNTVYDSLKAVQIVMQSKPTACELIDDIVIKCTENNLEHQKNRFFLNGDPKAVLLVEYRGNSLEEARKKAELAIQTLKKADLGYAFPIVEPPLAKRVWALRKAGLGLLANVSLDKKAVACVEDTAVTIEDLPDYIAEFDLLMQKFGQEAVHYAHAGDGELHIRPLLDLKKSEDVQLLAEISEASARLIKKYNGSLSGEHGDGRVRAPFIPIQVGEEIYNIFREIKYTWDPDGIFNPGKIVDPLPVQQDLRYEQDREEPEISTLFDFSDEGGILRSVEKCNGSGDCRKLPFSGGTMCPSYQATRNEADTTRARANVLREYLTHGGKAPFDHKEIHDIMDLCISCKGCKSECPSNVDMATLKAEFLYQYQKKNGISLRSRLFGHISKINEWLAPFSSIANFFFTNPLFSKLIQIPIGISVKRKLPVLAKTTFRKWYRNNIKQLQKQYAPSKEVYLFCDEFTNFYDVELGIKSVELLIRLGYDLKMVKHAYSGRAELSKGLLKEARKMAIENVTIFQSLISEDRPLIGIEPSAILGFRDEYVKLVPDEMKANAKTLSENTFLIDEFISREIQNGNIKTDAFTTDSRHIVLHGHCHQKALSSVEDSAWLLSLPKNHSVEIIPSGCCGMAGSFGYEKEHYDISMKIGELVLFPFIRKTNSDTTIAATGHSCRHQIYDGQKRIAKHPVEILYDALI